MDEKPYKSISDLYAYLEKHADNLTEREISYMLGVLKTLKDLFESEADFLADGHTLPAPAPEPSIWERIKHGLSFH